MNKMNNTKRLPTDQEIWNHIVKLGLENYFAQSKPQGVEQ